MKYMRDRLNKRNHYSIRKLTIGAFSVLIGISFMSSAQTAKADTLPNGSQSAVTKKLADDSVHGKVDKATATNSSNETAITTSNAATSTKQQAVTTYKAANKSQIEKSSATAKAAKATNNVTPNNFATTTSGTGVTNNQQDLKYQTLGPWQTGSYSYGNGTTPAKGGTPWPTLNVPDYDYNGNPNTAPIKSVGVLMDGTISFDKDFDIKAQMATAQGGRSTSQQGWSFTFYGDNATDAQILQGAGILTNQGVSGTFGVKVDTLQNVIDPNDQSVYPNLGPNTGYIEFVKNADGKIIGISGTQQVLRFDKTNKQVTYMPYDLNDVQDTADHNDNWAANRMNQYEISYDSKTHMLTFSITAPTDYITAEGQYTKVFDQLSVNVADLGVTDYSKAYKVAITGAAYPGSNVTGVDRMRNLITGNLGGEPDNTTYTPATKPNEVANGAKDIPAQNGIKNIGPNYTGKDKLPDNTKVDWDNKGNNGLPIDPATGQEIDTNTPAIYDNVPATVTYPDGSTAKVNEQIVVGNVINVTPTKPGQNPEPAPDGYEQVTFDAVNGHFGTDTNSPTRVIYDIKSGTTKEEVLSQLDPQANTDYNQNTESWDPELPATFTDKDTVNGYTVTFNKYDNKIYIPQGGSVTNPYGTATTEKQVTDQVKVTPDMPAGTKITVDNPSELPDGKTPGTVNVPVTVTYPDGSKSQTQVKVTTGNEPDSDSHKVTGGSVTNPYGTATTEKQVTDQVKVTPDMPAGTKITVDNPSELPDGKTPGTVNVPVTVTYPDGSKSQTQVKVTTGNEPDSDSHKVTGGSVTNPYGTATTEKQVTDQVKVTPDMPAGTKITVDNPSELPDGKTPGTVNVPVTVTYPDGSKSQTQVKVTTGNEPDSDSHKVTGGSVTNPYGTATTEKQVTDQVKVTPDMPAGTKITVDNPSELPDGKTPGTVNVPVTVTYPDGSKSQTQVKVTTGNEPDSDSHKVTGGSVTNPYGTATTEKQVTDQVKVTPDMPAGTKITVDNPSELPDGKTPGTVNVPVTVTYPDGSKSQTQVKVTTGNEPDSDSHKVTGGSVTNPYGTATTEKQVTDQVKVTPDMPAGTKITVDNPSELPDGKTPGTVNVPVTVTYPDGSKSQTQVKVTTGNEPDSDSHKVTGGSVTNPYGTATTEKQVTDQVKVTPDMPAGTKITVDNPSELPDGKTPGTVNVPVTVTYPDGSKSQTQVKVTTGNEPDSDSHKVTGGSVTNPYGTATTEKQVTDQVKVTPDMPAGTKITVDNPSELPDGKTPGTVNVPVTVTYPDGSKSQTQVKVTTGNEPDSDSHKVTGGSVTNPYGTATTEKQVTDQVKVTPDMPAGTKITVDNPSELPDGKTPGTVNVPVTVTYPDGSKSQTQVKVTTGNEPDSDSHKVTGGSVTNPYGTATTEKQVTDQVKVTPDMPAGTKITVDNPSELPDGKTPGTVNVPVTVTYPDGSKSQTQVKVTTGNEPDSDSHKVTGGSVTNPYGTATTEKQVTDQVKVTPDMPAGTKITVDNPSELPDGKTPGTVNVPVTVTYPDGSKSQTQVKVTTGNEPDSDSHKVTGGSVTNPYGTATTEKQVTDQVKVTPDMPAGTKITVDNPSELPDGKTPGTVNVPVTVTYPDGSKSQTQVKVTTGNEPDSDSHKVTGGSVTNPYGTATTEKQVTDQVKVTPDMPAGTKITVDNPSELPDGKTPGTVNVPVTVTYPDGSKSQTQVKVTTGNEPDSDSHKVTGGSVTNPYGTATTEKQVTDQVKVTPDMPAGTKITVDNPSELPDGKTPGTVNVPVTVTYPDGSKSQTQVKVTTGNEPDSDSHKVTGGSVTNPYGTATTEKQVTDQVKVTPDMPAGTKITVDNPSELPDGKTPGTVNVPVTVTYPDGSKSQTQVKVTTGNEPDSDSHKVTGGSVTNPYGTATTEKQVTDQVKVTPDMPAGTKITVDNPSELPDGKTPGTVNVPVTVTYPDGSKSQTQVKVTTGNEPDSDSHKVTGGSVTNPYGTATTEKQVTDQVKVTPDMPAGTKITVDNPSELPDGKTPGTVNVPVTVTYPDGSKSQTQVKVTTGNEPDSDSHKVTGGSVTNPYGTATTEKQVTDQVKVTPDMPAGTKITVDNPSELPDGKTPGTVNVPVTVTYPDGSKSQTQVKVTTGNEPDSDSHKVTGGSVTNPYGTATTEKQVTDQVKVTPDMPAGTKITVDNPSELPDGKTPGTVNVPVTVTYPDGSKSQTQVKVTTGNEPDSDSHKVTGGSVTNPYGTATTEKQVTDQVKVTPDMPAGTKITVDNPSELPDGKTPGTVNVPVTVTYPDGSKSQTQVKVTTGNEPDKGMVTYPNNTTVKQGDNTTVTPNIPEGEHPTFKPGDTSKLPDGVKVTVDPNGDVHVTTSKDTPTGTVNIPVEVTNNGKTDTVNVPVEVTPGDKTPEPGKVTYPDNTTVKQGDNTTVTPNIPEGEHPTFKPGDTSKLPDGVRVTVDPNGDVHVTTSKDTPTGTVNIPVEVTNNGKTDTVNVPVEVTPGDQTPETGKVTYPNNTTVKQGDNTIVTPNIPEGEHPTFKPGDTSKLPDGVRVTVDPNGDVHVTTSKDTPTGTVNIPVEVTNNGKTDTVNVPVEVTPGDQTPETGKVTYPNNTTVKQGDNTTVTPNIPEGEHPTFKPGDTSKLPDGVKVTVDPNGDVHVTTSKDTPTGTINIPVEVTNNGKTDTVNVPVEVTPSDNGGTTGGDQGNTGTTIPGGNTGDNNNNGNDNTNTGNNGGNTDNGNTNNTDNGDNGNTTIPKDENTDDNGTATTPKGENTNDNGITTMPKSENTNNVLTPMENSHSNISTSNTSYKASSSYKENVASSNKMANMNRANNAKKLPQTGESKNTAAAIAGLVLVGVAGLIGLAIDGRRRRK